MSPKYFLHTFKGSWMIELKWTLDRLPAKDSFVAQKC